MLKSSHREVMVFLLGGLAALGGVTIHSEKSSFPERCSRPYRPELPGDRRWDDRAQESVPADNQRSR